MKILIMLRFKKGSNGLISLGTDWDSMVMESILKNKYSVFTLLQQELLNVYELLEEIMTYQPDIVLLYKDMENEKFLLSFIELMKRECPEQKYIIWNYENTQSLEPYIQADMVSKEMPIRLNYYSSDRCPLEQYYELGIPVSIYNSLLDKNIVMSDDEIINELKFIKKNIPNLKYACLYSNIDTYHCNSLVTKYCNDENLMIKMLPQHDSMTSVALWNGVKACFTGMYPNTSYASSKHIFVEKNDNIEQMFTDLSHYVEINHTIFHKNIVSIQSNLTSNTGYVLSNEINIEELEPQHYTFTLNGSEERKIVIQNYSKYTEMDNVSTFVVLNEREDFETFKYDYQQFSKTGCLNSTRMWKADMIDYCRFWNSSCCHIDSIPRFRLNNNELYPCLSSDYKAGDLSEGAYQISIKLKREKAKLNKKRNCEECFRLKECSRCIALPSFLNQEDFCEMIRDKMNFPYLNKAIMSLTYLYKGQLLPELASKDKTRVRAVTPNNYIFVEPKDKDGSLSIDGNVFMFVIQGDKPRYLLFSLSTRKILRINQYFFKLCEFIARGYTVNEITSVTGTMKIEDIVSIEQDYSKALNILRNYQMVE